jgi:hypothetical protein
MKIKVETIQKRLIVLRDKWQQESKDWYARGDKPITGAKRNERLASYCYANMAHEKFRELERVFKIKAV